MITIHLLKAIGLPGEGEGGQEKILIKPEKHCVRSERVV